MADLKCGIGRFSVAAGVLTQQTITGVVDQNGNAFTPKVFILYTDPNGYGTAQYVAQSLGFDDGTNAVGMCTHSQWQFDNYFASAASHPTNSMMNSAALFTQHFITLGKITAISSGSFGVTFSINEFGASYGYIALGGADLEFKLGITGTISAITTITTTFEPKGGMFASIPTATGGIVDNLTILPSIGFCGFDLVQFGNSTINKDVETSITGYRYQVDENVIVGVDPDAGTATDIAYVSELAALSFSVTRRISNSGFIYLVFNQPCYVGTFLQPIDDGVASVAIPNIRPVFVALSSVAAPHSDAIQSNMQWCFGASNGVTSRCYWQATLNGGTISANGGQRAGLAKALFTAIPNGSDSADATPTGQIDDLTFNANGFRATWSECDGLAREIFYIAFGTEAEQNTHSGLYKMVPSKRNDTLYTSFDPITIEDFKIP